MSVQDFIFFNSEGVVGKDENAVMAHVLIAGESLDQQPSETKRQEKRSAKSRPGLK